MYAYETSYYSEQPAEAFKNYLLPVNNEINPKDDIKHLQTLKQVDIVMKYTLIFYDILQKYWQEANKNWYLTNLREFIANKTSI